MSDPQVVLASFNEAGSDLMEKTLAEYHAFHVKSVAHLTTDLAEKYGNDSAHSFAYWLFRYSSLSAKLAEADTVRKPRPHDYALIKSGAELRSTPLGHITCDPVGPISMGCSSPSLANVWYRDDIPPGSLLALAGKYLCVLMNYQKDKKS